MLVLIDGIKAGSVTSGTTSFENLPLDQIDRIEIIRGPRSSLYGSEAIGGVIQIFTRKGGGKLKPSLSMGEVVIVQSMVPLDCQEVEKKGGLT